MFLTDTSRKLLEIMKRFPVLTASIHIASDDSAPKFLKGSIPRCGRLWPFRVTELAPGEGAMMKLARRHDDTNCGLAAPHLSLNAGPTISRL